MARYRERDETDLAWSDMRRRITRQLDTEISAVRERILNKLLIGAWEEFSKSLESGETLQMESHVASWVADAMSEALKPRIETLDVANMSREA